MNRKAKGTKGERELIKFFNETGLWGAFRSAGSGSSRYPSPDLIAANAIRRLAIECKVTKDKKKYFQNKEIEQLNKFSQLFGAESWVGVKFPNEPWYFLIPEDLRDTGACWAVSIELAKRRGLTKEELIR
jgi:holliday junction resolvase Hjr